MIKAIPSIFNYKQWNVNDKEQRMWKSMSLLGEFLVLIAPLSMLQIIGSYTTVCRFFVLQLTRDTDGPTNRVVDSRARD